MTYEEYVLNNNKFLSKIIESSNWNSKEKDFQKNRILIYSKRTIEEGKIDNQYASITHEIKSYELLEKLGKIEKLSDSNHNSGPDFQLNQYRIECVCCSSGKTNIERYRTNHCKKSIICDYKEVEKIILPRITAELIEKRNKIYSYIEEGKIRSNEAIIISISLGEIARDFRSDKYGFEILKVLLGVGDFQFVFNRFNRAVRGQFGHNNSIIKINTKGQEVPLDANFFLDEKNSIISAILFSDAQITELYDNTNTYLFCNPKAKNRIRVRDFENFVYWKANKNGEYIPRKNGKNLWNEFEKKWF